MHWTRVLRSLRTTTPNTKTIVPGDVRVRFAPSPTGYLHLGGLRSALYNYLFAKKHGGSFILRIEDTDQTRLVPGAVEALIEDLKWSGLTPDEGPLDLGGDRGPYTQSSRLSIYAEKALELMDRRRAYRCFCTEHRLDLLRKDAVRRGEYFRGYDNRCRDLSSDDVSARIQDGVPHVVRLVMDDAVAFEDLIYGQTSDAPTEGDPILLKSDGFPTYHLANVVDDHLMEVSHVLRGAEWLPSTPKHLRIYQAFEWQPPSFAHLPLIMNADGIKLSKRNESLRLSFLRDAGFAPETLMTYLCAMGGGVITHEERQHAEDEFRVHSIPSLISAFDLRRLSKSPGRLDDARLNLYSRSDLLQRLQTLDGQKTLIESLRKFLLSEFGQNLTQFSDDEMLRILKWSSDRVFTVKDLLSEDLKFIWANPDRALWTRVC